MVRYKDRTENEGKSRQCPLKDITLKTWRTLAQDLFKKLQASLAPWKQNEASLNIFSQYCIHDKKEILK